MIEFQERYKDKIDFLFIYILEAHASDEWPLGNHVEIEQHKTLEERVKAAKTFVERYSFTYPVVVDSIKNDFNENYSVWPERWFILHKGEIKHVSYPTDRGHSREDMEHALKQWSNQKDIIE